MQFTYRNPARSTDPASTLPGARSLVVGARSYHRARPDRPESTAGEVARYAWEDHYGPLRDALGVLADRLTRDGWKARVVADDNALVDREAAYRAGLGWYGKSGNVLLPGQGSWFVLGSVITDAPLPPDAPLDDGCGSCTRCVDGCPTGAIVAPGLLDARRCLAWLVQAPGVFPRQHRIALGGRLYGCDDCQEVCPPNRAVDRRGAPSELLASDHNDHDPDRGSAWVPLLELLAADDETLLARHGRWYIADRHPRHLRRNALVALGNIGDGRRHEVAAALASALAHEDPLVRGHAVWAAARLGRHDLLAALERAAVDGTETDPDVLAELAELPE